MKVQIIDSQDHNKIKIIVPLDELVLVEDVDALLFDTKDTFVCSNEPSQIATNLKIEKSDTQELFNVELELPMPLDTTELLFCFLQHSDNNYNVLPIYDNKELLNYVASTSGILIGKCDCENHPASIGQIVLYYGFKLALSTLQYLEAITMWNNLHKVSSGKSSCGCNK